MILATEEVAIGGGGGWVGCRGGAPGGRRYR